jgi:hypothetical protein
VTRILCALLASACVGCGAHLPPHVWLPLDHTDSASLFWWTDAGLCQLRVVYGAGDTYRSLTVPVDASVCLGWLTGDGYNIRPEAK